MSTKLLLVILLIPNFGFHAAAMETTKYEESKNGNEGKNSPRTPRLNPGKCENAALRRYASSQLQIADFHADSGKDNSPVKPMSRSAPEATSHFESEYTDADIEELIARGPLAERLRCLYEEELYDKMRRGLLGEVFRAATPAVVLTTTLLKRRGTLEVFRMNYVDFAISSISNNYRVGDLESIGIVLKDCIYYLHGLPFKEIPLQIATILNSLHKAAHEVQWPKPVPVLLGSFLFLRFIAPALVHQSCLRPNPETARALRDLAIAIQLISNQEDPEAGRPLYPLLDTLRALHHPTAEFLLRIATAFPDITAEIPDVAFEEQVTVLHRRSVVQFSGI